MTEFSPNLKQQQAIDLIEGPLLLLAGPGTGKTYTLIKRVEKMLQDGILPENILCLTFSDAASNEMKIRLVEKIGAKAAGVNVCTYHSFCMEIIKQNPDEFELGRSIQMADDVTKQAILKESIDNTGEIEFLKDKWGNKYYYIPAILAGIETIKRERINKQAYFEYINENWQRELDEKKLELKRRIENKKPTKDFTNKLSLLEKKIGKACEFWKIFEIYKKRLNENGLIDYSDMINLVLDKMEEDEDFSARITKEYKYLLVDEYQDTSKVQNDLIFNILKGAKTDNIFVVGDDDQIIYSFQGARSSNLADFLFQFKNAKIICLEENRRSTQTILDFAQCLISDDLFRLNNHPDFNIQKNLIAKNEAVIRKQEKIKLNIYADFIQENNAIVQEIEKLIKNGVQPEEIAILTRKNEPLENFARLLKQKNIPFALSKNQDAFEIPSFIQTYFYLKLVTNSYLQQDKFFGLFSFEPFKIEDKILAGLIFQAKKTNSAFIEILKKSDCPKIQKFVQTLNEITIKKSYTPVVCLVYEIITKTGILEYYSNNGTNRFENINALKRMIDEAHSYALLHRTARLNDFVLHLDTYFNQNIKIELKKSPFKSNAIQLLTYHGSKGREFEYVFLPNLTAKAFEKASGGTKILNLPVEKSKFSRDDSINTDAELKRLLFVGITRAKFGLYLSYANTFENAPQTASKYISNMFPNANNLVEQKIFEIDEDSKTNEIIKDLKIQYNTDEFKKELKDKVQNLIISQTSLNKYINCPLQYLYGDILEIPVYAEDRDVLIYGSCMHYAIDFMTKDAIKAARWNNSILMCQKFEQKMAESEFSTPEKRMEFLSRGKNSIENNFHALIQTDPKNIVSTECRMELEFEGVTLKGFADRILKGADGKIHIFDFKTGSYKKIRSGENYYNQLRFYKFLYESLHKNEKIGTCALIFFEEGCKTSFPEEDLTNNEEIKTIIQKVIKGIKSLDFEPKKNPENCRFCDYKLICKLHNLQA